ncbi:MAG TPA: SH3 domain-containing protein [Chloroflexaceae bacterium]|nr:SH3 domain-containing protein [Chloroflexaceae bacterium]
MPPRVDPRDWDRHFRPGAPRRGGPLRALANVLLIGSAVALLGGGAFFGLRFGIDRVRANNAATAVAVQTSNAVVLAARTARALEATSTAAAVVVAPTPTAPPAAAPIGRGSVIAGGNLRSQPVVSPETVIGQVCAGDEVDFLEQSTAADGSLWYRIRVTEVSGACTPQRVTLGSLGWASSTLLSPPASP